jgi:hypothetical protein
VEMDGACGAMPPHAAMCLGDDRNDALAWPPQSPLHSKCGGRWAHKPHLRSRETGVSRTYVTSSCKQ